MGEAIREAIRVALLPRLVASPEFREGLVPPPRFREASLSSHTKSNPERISVHFPNVGQASPIPSPLVREASTQQEILP